MTALAEWFVSDGAEVRGADVEEVFPTDAVLARHHIAIQNMDEPLPQQVDVVVASPAFAGHALLRQAQSQGIPTYSWEEFMGPRISSTKNIAVTGTHGKTTTTAMLGCALLSTALDPSILVGFTVPQLGGNFHRGNSDILVWEADEYKKKLHFSQPYGVVLTAIDYDHVDIYPTREEYELEYIEYVKKIPEDGFLVYNADDTFQVRLSELCRGARLGYGQRAGDYRILNMDASARTCAIQLPNGERVSIQLSVIGEHNLRNAISALIAGLQMGGSPQDLTAGLSGYAGTKRRLELITEKSDMTIVDDYGHHPVEIQASLQALRSAYSHRRLVCVFHPHTFSRTQAFLKDFAAALDNADVVGIIEVYGSARESKGTVTASDIIHLMKVTADALADVHAAVDWLARIARPGDVIVSMGAGDVWKSTELFAQKI